MPAAKEAVVPAAAEFGLYAGPSNVPVYQLSWSSFDAGSEVHLSGPKLPTPATSTKREDEN